MRYWNRKKKANSLISIKTKTREKKGLCIHKYSTKDIDKTQDQ